jgi:hypothetical protein
MLPLSSYHVLLGWVDVASDVWGVYSTGVIAQRIQPLCEVSFNSFFSGCFMMQLLLLLGNLIAQSLLAMRTAIKGAYKAGDEEIGKINRPSRRRILIAGVRGFFNLELAYQEWKKREAPTKAQMEACIYYKMVELIFEAPQVVIAWVVLLTRALIQNAREVIPAQHNDETSNLPSYIVVLQFSSALFGLVSLSLGALDFLRLHPRSFWATTPPSRLYLGLVDTSPETRAWSFFVWLYAFISMLSRGCFYTLLAYFFVVDPFFRNARSVVGLSWVVGVVAIGSFILNCSLLIPIKAWLILPASFISMFINIPWVAAKHDGYRYLSPDVCWPSWVMEFVYFWATVGMCLYLIVVSEAPFSIVCQNDIVSANVDSVVPTWLFVTSFVGSIVVAGSSLTLFMALSGRVHAVRRRYFKVHAKPRADDQHQLDAACADLNFPRSMPVLKYRVQRSGSWGMPTMVLETGETK